MNWLKGVLNWASSAFAALFGAVTNPVQAVTALWHFISSVHSLVSWLFGNPVLTYVLAHVRWLSAWWDALLATRDALHALAAWIWLTWIKPAVTRLQAEITALRAWTYVQLFILRVIVYDLYRASLAYTTRLVSAERAARIRAVQAEHAAMLAGLKATLATVQRQAATGYDGTRRARSGIIGDLARELADREPAIAHLVPRLVGYVIDLESIDNPLLRFLATKLLNEVLAKVGADKAAGDLLGVLVGQLTGGGPPKDLSGVARDVGERLNALEKQWADFMRHGGPEVENAGDQWKDITGVLADVAILGVFGLAVADPRAWATGVAGTVGVAGNAALDTVVKALRAI